MKIGNLTIFQKKEVELGDGHVNQYILFEHKRLFSIIVYGWEEVGDQMRAHSHAFNLWAILLNGGYEEYVYTDSSNGVKRRLNKVYNKFVPRFIGKNYNHQIIKALPNTWTVLITGPWQANWVEYFSDSDTTVTYSWGRKVVDKVRGFRVGA